MPIEPVSDETQQPLPNAPSDSDNGVTWTTPAPGLSYIDQLATEPKVAAAEHTPTREEAKAMFAENPGLWSVLTTEGTVTRDQC